MKKQFIILIVFAVIAFSSCQSRTANSNIDQGPTTVTSPEPTRQKTAEELKQELGQKESENPANYLAVRYNSTLRKDLLGQIVIEGRIDNTATIAGFKDPIIEVDFQAASGTSLKTQQFTRYEILGPGYGVTYKFKAFAPDQTQKINVSLISATPIASK